MKAGMRTALGGLLLLAVAAGCTQAPPPPPNPPSPQPPAPVGDTSLPVVSGNTQAAADVAAVAGLNASFDPARDPARDLETAKVEAQRGGKRIMLDVGGERCERCHILDTFVEGDAEIRSFRDEHYVWMKVNFSEENQNPAFLARFPQVNTYPHLFVLEADGTLVHSQLTGELEKGEGYDRAKFLAFLTQWTAAAPR